jgi:2-aminoadipate transaminase
VTLAEEIQVDGLFTSAAEHSVTFVPGSHFTVERNQNAIRLAFAGVTPEEIDEGIRRLARAMQHLSGKVTSR